MLTDSELFILWFDWCMFTIHTTTTSVSSHISECHALYLHDPPLQSLTTCFLLLFSDSFSFQNSLWYCNGTLWLSWLLMLNYTMRYNVQVSVIIFMMYVSLLYFWKIQRKSEIKYYPLTYIKSKIFTFTNIGK